MTNPIHRLAQNIYDNYQARLKDHRNEEFSFVVKLDEREIKISYTPEIRSGHTINRPVTIMEFRKEISVVECDQICSRLKELGLAIDKLVVKDEQGQTRYAGGKRSRIRTKRSPKTDNN